MESKSAKDLFSDHTKSSMKQKPNKRPYTISQLNEMQLFGIKWAPLNVPLDRRFQTLAASAWTIAFMFGIVVFWCLSLYLIIFTKFWWIIGLYLLWIWTIDKETSENGGRAREWVRSWTWWRFNRDYFPLRLEKLPEAKLDRDKNYLLCCFPHGVMATGSVNAFGTKFAGYEDFFPHHKPHLVFFYQLFSVPFLREILLGLGGISSSARSINYVLSRPEGGNLCVIMVGGLAEISYCKPGSYRLILKNRKGFVKLALKNGTPLVPVLSFGETDLYDVPDGPRMTYFQEKLRKWTGFSLVVPRGRGFFQYSFGVLPRRTPVATVVGVPMEVPKIEVPTSEQVDEYHSKFIKRLTEMFEEQKYKYLDSPEDKKIIID